MGADQSKPDDQPGAVDAADAADFASHSPTAAEAKKARLNRRGTEIERERGGSGGGGEDDYEEEDVDGFNVDSGKADARKKGRKKRPPRRMREGDGEERDPEEAASRDALNFNREYELPSLHGAAAFAASSPAAGAAASPSARSPGAPGEEDPEPQYDSDGNLIEDDQWNEQALAPGRPRNKGALGVGSPSADGGALADAADDGGEFDAEALKKEFAFKTVAATEAERMDFEYELSELSARLGPALKILAAGYDEAVMHDAYMRPTSSYQSYNLRPPQQERYADDEYQLQDLGPNGTRRPSAVSHYYLDETQNYGHEYQPAAVPFSAEELQLQKAAAARRRRKIKVELAWLKQRKEEKAAEREAQRKKDDAIERSVNSKSGLSASSRKSQVSRRPSFGGNALGPPAGFGAKRTLGGGVPGMAVGQNMRGSMARGAGVPMGPTGVRSSVARSNMASGAASPRG